MCSIPGRSSQLKARSAHHRCITRDDGAAGPAAIDRRGDTSLVQDLDDALYPAMPRNALQFVPSAAAHPAAGLGAAIAAAVARPLSPAPDTPSGRVPPRVQLGPGWRFVDDPDVAAVPAAAR